VARSTGQNHLVGSLLTVQGVVHCTTGDLRAAVPALDDALESVMLLGGRDARPRVLGYLCWARVWTGDPGEAVALGEEAVELAAGGSVQDWQSASAEGMLGFARYAAGDLDGCLRVMLRAGGGPDLPAVRPLWRLRWFEVLAGAAAAAGDHRRAAGLAARAEALPASPRLHRRAAMVALTRAYAEQRDPATAAAHATRAAGSFARAGDTLGAARSHFWAASAYRLMGDPTAERELTAARADFASCGAQPRWLARLAGLPLEAEPRAHRLTGREREVLALLAESLTAAAIARRLGISAGTVHKHLAALYRKLGTTDRLATVLRARELGLIPG
jgi:DNA-binding CsgD family transcriptional regulator